MKSVLLNVLCVYICTWLVFYPVPAYADDTDSTTELVEEDPVGIKEGDPAPFNGVLFSTLSAARLLADLEANEALCQTRIDLEVSQAVNQKQLLLDTCNSNLEIRSEMYEARIQGHQDYSDFLEHRLTKPKVPGEVIFIIGIVTGVGITLGAGAAMYEIGSR